MLYFYLSLLESQDDQSRFEAMYINYKQAMYYSAYTILHDVQITEDAVHQAFIKIIENFKQFQEISSPQTKSFCVIVCRNTAIDMLRRDKKQHNISFDDLPVEISERNGMEDEVISNANVELIIEKIRQLPVIYKDIFLLHYGNGYSIKQIAKLINISNEVAKKRMQRARRQLIKMILKADD